MESRRDVFFFDLFYPKLDDLFLDKRELLFVEGLEKIGFLALPLKPSLSSCSIPLH